jgi:hypothetical protein
MLSLIWFFTSWRKGIRIYHSGEIFFFGGRTHFLLVVHGSPVLQVGRLCGEAPFLRQVVLAVFGFPSLHREPMPVVPRRLVSQHPFF